MFSSRRKPKRIVRGDHETSEQPEVDEDTGPVVRRPGNAPKPQSKLRLSFNPGEPNAANNDTNDSVKPARLGASVAARELPRHTATLNLSERHDHDRPSYNKTYLDELRNSTPSTPKDLSAYNSSTEEEQNVSSAIDVASKFGNVSSSGAASSIPSAAEIQEKKDRRARLAKEQEAKAGDGFISLEDYDSDGEFKPQRMQVGTYNQPDSGYAKDTRLVRDDEDIAEGFDEFVEDGNSNRIVMSRLGRKEDKRRERQKRKELIEEAEGASEEEGDDSDSDASLRHAYEFAQTHHGMEGMEAREARQRIANRPRQPEKTAQIPTLNAALGRIRELIQQAEAKKLAAEKRVEEIEQEKKDVEAQKEHIQKSLTELGQELEQSMIKTNGMTAGHQDVQSRGLESFGDG